MSNTAWGEEEKHTHTHTHYRHSSHEGPLTRPSMVSAGLQLYHSKDTNNWHECGQHHPIVLVNQQQSNPHKHIT